MSVPFFFGYIDEYSEIFEIHCFAALPTLGYYFTFCHAQYGGDRDTAVGV